MQSVEAQIISNGHFKFLVHRWFHVDLTDIQEQMIKLILSGEKRIVISCMTRYGKSFCVAIAILIYIRCNENKRVKIISPQTEQSMIIRNYLSQMILESEEFMGLVDVQLTGLDKLKSEVSKKRITFKNGCELMIMSAEGEANRLMGFGGDLIVLDESCLINYEVYTSKISRMLGDSPDSILVEIGNPWHPNNQMYQHWNDPAFTTFKVDYKDALKEGRITESFLEEQRRDLTPIEFKVLYEADFPDESKDSLFKLQWISGAEKKDFGNDWDASKIKKIISCDPADKGKDWTVLYWGYEYNGLYKVMDVYHEAQSENMQIASKIISWYREKGADLINIDTIGVGIGVVSRVKEVIGDKVKVNACHFGEGVGASGEEYPDKGDRQSDRKPTSGRKRFMNRKAEQYWRLREIFNDGRISLPQDRNIKKDLLAMGWELTSGEKIRILDPEDRSPDFADALVYFTWKQNNDIIVDFGGV